MALATGTRLGPYEVREQIGVGGMGEVYKARDTRLDRIVAVGSNQQVDAWRGPHTRVVDAAGKRLLPGFKRVMIDASPHTITGHSSAEERLDRSRPRGRWHQHHSGAHSEIPQPIQNEVIR